MNHYPHHIGDFNNATRHLTRLERSIYRDLLDRYYDTEQSLSGDSKHLCHKIMARSTEEVTAVEQVLNEFFTFVENRWYNAKCEEILTKYKSTREAKTAAGIASAKAKASRKALKNKGQRGNSTPVKHPLNTSPTPVTNQKPKPKPETTKDIAPTAQVAKAPVFNFKKVLLGLGVDKQIVDDWLVARKTRRASNTETALKAFLKIVDNSGMPLNEVVGICAAKGWVSFDPKWLENNDFSSNQVVSNKTQEQDFKQLHTNKGWREGL